MFYQPRVGVVGNADLEVLGVEASQDVDEFHGIPLSQRRKLNTGRTGPSTPPQRVPRPAYALRATARQPSLASRREFFGLAEPKLAKRAKAGGARRDRTADLLHAMQALSQLSYGPVTLSTPWATR